MCHLCHATIPIGFSSMTTHYPGRSRTLIQATGHHLVSVTECEGVWAELVAVIGQLPPHYAQHCQCSARHITETVAITVHYWIFSHRSNVPRNHRGAVMRRSFAPQEK
jgi:hypothetical protein